MLHPKPSQQMLQYLLNEGKLGGETISRHSGLLALLRNWILQTPNKLIDLDLGRTWAQGWAVC